MSESTLDSKPAPQPGTLRSFIPQASSPAHVTGTAAGLAAAGMVIISGAVHHWTGGQLGPAMIASGTTILTYLLGVYLHVPTQ